MPYQLMSSPRTKFRQREAADLAAIERGDKMFVFYMTTRDGKKVRTRIPASTKRVATVIAELNKSVSKLKACGYTREHIVGLIP